jgi:hypothetical protein
VIETGIWRFYKTTKMAVRLSLDHSPNSAESATHMK